MKKASKRFHPWLIGLLIIIVIGYVLSLRDIPTKITYGVSFSKFHSDELQLDWKEVYNALLNDLKVKHFRFSAHWPNTEPTEGEYNFSELDYQIKGAEKRGADFILAVGRRLPGWPECHEPEWAQDLPLKEKQEKILKYIETVVNRYKDSPSIVYWQVENEPFLAFFSRSHCGALDKEFLDKEIELVKKLDPSRSVLITDSGEFGYWWPAYRRGDVFGTSLYLYIWNRKIGPFRYPITPAFFRIKQSITELVWGKKQTMIVELSAEPWLLQPIISAPVPTLLERMGPEKFNEMIEFASKTGFDRQYLWGAEWWYWMKKIGYPEHWERAQELFR
ncbi:MAG: beta-galactosidase [bacterium]|nr:beta-galactosidase [bacterium]